MRVGERYHIMLNCEFPSSIVAQKVMRTGVALGFDMLTGTPGGGDVNKAQAQLSGVDGVIILLAQPVEPSGQNERAGQWLMARYGMARYAGKPTCVICAGDVIRPPVSVVPAGELLSIAEDLSYESHCELIAFLTDFAHTIDAVQSKDIYQRPPFVRNFVRHRTTVRPPDQLQYETEVELVCLESGLADVSHSIYPNYALCPRSIAGTPQVDIISRDAHHTITIDPTAQDESKHTWKLTISPPLREQDKLRYGYRCMFTSTDERDTAVVIPSHPVMHHYFINHVTEALQMEVWCEGVSIAQVEPAAHIGRTINEQTLRTNETLRIGSGLTRYRFLTEDRITLNVVKPRLGFTYVLKWTGS